MKKNSRRQTSFPVPFGLSLLLVVFLARAFFTFAAISLSTAKNDYSVSRSMADHKTAYAEASNRAEEKIAALNEDARLDPAGAESEVNFEIEIDSTQSLEVTCRWNEETGSYETTTWQVVSTREWQPDTTLPVMQAEDGADTADRS